MKSLLVALDDTPGSTAALRFALSRAKSHGAKLAGVSILDVPYLTAPEPGSIGSAYYKYRADVAHLKKAHETSQQLIRQFLEQCDAQGVKSEAAALEGSPADQLRGAAAMHDAIAVGRDCNFHGQANAGASELVEQLLKRSPRPLIIAPSGAQDPSRISVIAYDGSIPAARALQIFALLDLAKDTEVHVLSIDPRQDVADRWGQEARGYLALYGVSCKAHAIASSADPTDLVIAEARILGADLIVMGAYGHRGWRESLLGSFTTRMISQCTTSLFIHH